MPLGLGGSIGHAYVEVTVRGDGMNDDIRRILNDAVDDVDMKSAGRKAGRDYTEGFDEETQKEFKKASKGPGWKKAMENLDWTQGLANSTERYFDSPNWRAFVKKAREEWGDVGELAAAEMEAGFRQAGNLRGISQQQRDFQKRVNDLTIRLQQQTDDALYKEAVERNKKLDKLNQERIKADQAAFNIEFNMMRQVEEFRRRQAKADQEEAVRVKKRAEELRVAARRVDNIFAKIGDTTGALFGRGSRNNFLNFIGSAVRGLTNLVLLGPRLAAKFGQSLVDTFKKAGGGVAGLAASATQAALGLGGALLAVAAAGPIAAGALVALGFVIGPLAALFSGLLGLVGALVSTLSFALVGAVGILAGALVPLIAGIGLVVAGFIAMDDAQKKVLKADLKPATDAFRNLGDTAFKTMTRDIGKNAKDLAPVIKNLNPLVESLGNAVADVGTSWTKSLTGPGFQHFVNVLNRTLPVMLRRLGNITSNTLGGLGGIFEGMTPTLRRFLAWLDRITGRFSDWANSVADKKAIRNFFNDAAESAKSLGGFLDDVWDLVRKILGAGKDTGDTLFDKMGESVRKFTKYLDDNPDALKDFFANAADVAVDLGKIAINLGKIFDALDNPRNRKNMQSFLGFLTALSSGDVTPEQSKWENFAGVLNQIGGFLTSPRLDPQNANFGSEWQETFNSIWSGIRSGWDAFDSWWRNDVSDNFVVNKIRAWILGIPGAVQDLWASLRRSFSSFFSGGGGSGLMPQSIELPKVNIAKTATQIQGFFSGLGARITNWIGNINWSKIIPNPLPRIRAFFSGLASSITNWIGDVNWAGIIPSPVGRVKGFFTGMASDIANWIGDVDWSDIISNPTDMIVGWFESLAGQVEDLLSFSVHISWPDPPGWVDKLGGGIRSLDPRSATGGVFNGAQRRIIGEEGPEAVVPLNRPLDQVDPTVRALSAFAQGIPLPNVRANGSNGQAPITINVTTPASDARAVALETMNYLTATAY